MKKIILMLAFCGALATVSAQNGTGGEDMNSPNTGTSNPTYTPNPSTNQNPSNDNPASSDQGGTGQGGSDQGTNGSYQGDKSSASAQTNQNNMDVPDNVKNAFSDKYQDAKATWSREGQNYKARFKENAVEREETIVVYDRNGDIVRTQRMLKFEDYPESISKYYKDQNADMKGYDVWEVTGNGPTRYYSSHNGKMTWFDNEGNVMHGTANAQGTHKAGSTQKSRSSSAHKSSSKSHNSGSKRSSVNTGGDNTDTDIDRNRRP